jgi:serine protease AprX
VRAHRFALLVAALVLTATPALVGGTALAAPTATPAGTLDPWLVTQLDKAAANAQVPVMLRADTTQHALDAAARAGLTATQQWAQVAIVVAAGTPAQIRAAAADPVVHYVEGNRPVEFFGSTNNDTTRANETRATLDDSAGHDIDGRGITVAVIDTGVDGTHPYFRQADGTSKVVVNLKAVCPNVPVSGGVLNNIPPGVPSSDQCFAPAPDNDTDTRTAGGHGTHVAGIAAGVDSETAAPAKVKVHGAAPGAKLAMLSVNANDAFIATNAALNWLLDHHATPCGGAPTAACPAIRVVNNSYGPQGGGAFNPASAAVVIQRKLVQQGVVMVWAAGNDGGNGSEATPMTNPPAQDAATPGVLSVASYDDGGVASRDNKTSSFSSRGRAADQASWPDVAAPGSLILSSCRVTLTMCAGNPSYDNGNFQTISGTSMAAPYIAGVVADLLQANPGLTPAQVEYLLEDTAHPYAGGAPYAADTKNPAGTVSSFDKGQAGRRSRGDRQGARHDRR